MFVKELMRKSVVTVREDDDVKTICALLTKHKISGLPVLNKTGKLVGFISERDVIAAVPRKNFIDKKARELMSKRVKTITEDAPLIQASKIFTVKTFRHLPVVRGGKLVGIVTRKDVTTQMMKHYY